MEKKLSKWEASAIGLGNIIGAGIFVLAGTTIYDAGPGALIAFAITAVLALTIALNSAELSSKIITHGGLYSFAKETMGDSAGFMVGWLRSISYSIAASAVALGFGAYLLSFFSLPYYFVIIAAAGMIAFATFLNYMGISAVARVEKYLVILTVAGLVLFIIISIFYGKWEVSRFTPLAPMGFESIIVAASLSFFAYSGFNTIATLTPEVKNGAKNVPFAIIFALVVSTVLYILVVTGMLALMPWQNYSISADPLTNALHFSNAPVFVGYTIAIVAIIATFTVTVSLIVAGSRTLLQMSEDKVLPEWIQGRRKDSPKKAVILIGGLAVAALFLGNVQIIALASNFGVIFSYALTGLFVVILRHRKVKGEFSSPLYPYVQIASVLLSLLIMYALGVRAIYLGFITIIVGMMIYYFEKEARAKGSEHNNQSSKSHNKDSDAGKVQN